MKRPIPRRDYLNPNKLVAFTGPIKVGELATKLNLKVGDVMKKLMGMGMMLTMNQTIDFDTAKEVVESFGSTIVDPPPPSSDFTGFTAEEIKKTPILQYFSFGHLKEPQQSMSEMFARLAAHVVRSTSSHNYERRVALRKLLEAKDAAVRATFTGSQT